MILIPVPSNAFYRTFQSQKRPVISLFCRSKTGFSPDGHELITFSRNPDNHPDNTSLATPGHFGCCFNVSGTDRHGRARLGPLYSL
jgi:hypothetical protein